MKLLFSLLSLLLISSPVFAEVIIYTGTGKSSFLVTGGITRPDKVTIIMDTATLQTEIVTAISAKTGQPRKYVSSEQVLNVGRVETVNSKNKVINTFASAIAEYTSVDNFLCYLSKFSGPAGSVVIRTGNAAVNFPKTLGGGVTSVTDGGVGTSTVSVTFNSSLTLKANADGIDSVEGRLEAIERYKAAGFVEF